MTEAFQLPFWTPWGPWGLGLSYDAAWFWATIAGILLIFNRIGNITVDLSIILQIAVNSYCSRRRNCRQLHRQDTSRPCLQHGLHLFWLFQLCEIRL